jgi:hypothetical protein
MIKSHDMVADQAAVQYNVTWSRTTPIVVSVFDDAYSNVMTLECDHRFGIDVVGDPENILSFRYACSAAINPIEHWVMETLFPGGDGTSITIGLGRELLNGQMPGMYISNGYIVVKSSTDKMFLIFDPETGILRDVMIVYMPISGAYCFSDLQTEWAHELGEDILFNINSWLSTISENVLNPANWIINGIGLSYGIYLTDDNELVSYSDLTIGSFHRSTEVRINLVSMLTAGIYELTAAGIVIGFLGPSEAVLAAVGVSSELIMAARLATAIGYVTVGLGILKDQMTGDLNRLVEKPWYTYKIDGKIVYQEILIYPLSPLDILKQDYLLYRFVFG